VNHLSVSFKLEQTKERWRVTIIIKGASVFVALNVKQVIEIDRFVGLKSCVW